MIEFLKKGNEIHIKKNKLGSFTRWCGGEVTDECIKKGKNSPNSAIRKKAIFADNARKWQKGTKIVIAGDGTNTKNFFSKVGSFINNNPLLVNTALSGISSIVSANKLSKAADLYAEAKNEEMKSFKTKTWADKYKEALKKLNDRSDIVNMSRAYNQASGDVAQEVQEKQLLINEEVAQQYEQALLGLSDAWGGIISGLSLWVTSNTKTPSTKTTSTTSSISIPTTTSNFWQLPYLTTTPLNSYSNPNTFWNL